MIDDQDRYSRLRLISWWRQERLGTARVLVVGAGALGNEVVKNLALLGLGTTYLIDLDVVEPSNLSRSVLFRDEDGGQPKADVAARRARELNPEITIIPMHGDVITDLGLGIFAEVDLVIGCLDNREARLWVNRQCWKTGTPWIDAGIQEIQGVVKVFVPPDSACYECAMTERDYQLLNLRYSCPLLSRDEILAGQGAHGPDDRLDDGGASGPGSAQAAARPAGRGRLGSGFQRSGESVLLDAIAVSRRLLEPRDLSRAARAAAGPRRYRVGALSGARRAAGRAAAPGPGPRAGRRGRLPAVRVAGRAHAAAVKVKASEAVCPNCREAGPAGVASRVEEGSPLAALPLSRVGIPPYDIVRVDGASGSGILPPGRRPAGRQGGLGIKPLSGDEIIFGEMSVREPERRLRPDRDRRFACAGI